MWSFSENYCYYYLIFDQNIDARLSTHDSQKKTIETKQAFCSSELLYYQTISENNCMNIDYKLQLHAFINFCYRNFTLENFQRNKSKGLPTDGPSPRDSVCRWNYLTSSGYHPEDEEKQPALTEEIWISGF